MQKIGKRKLISIVKQYIDVPNNERYIEYKYYGGFSKITFYSNVYLNVLNFDVEYYITAKYTIFLGKETLEIEAKATNYNDSWRKFIEL